MRSSHRWAYENTSYRPGIYREPRRGLVRRTGGHYLLGVGFTDPVISKLTTGQRPRGRPLDVARAGLGALLCRSPISAVSRHLPPGRLLAFWSLPRSSSSTATPALATSAHRRHPRSRTQNWET